MRVMSIQKEGGRGMVLKDMTEKAEVQSFKDNPMTQCYYDLNLLTGCSMNYDFFR